MNYKSFSFIFHSYIHLYVLILIFILTTQGFYLYNKFSLELEKEVIILQREVLGDGCCAICF